MMSVTARRSWLYVSGDHPERFAKAVASGADMVICDLEDAVRAANKAIARHAVADWLRGHRAVVRVNGVGTKWHDDDVAAIADAPGLIAVLLPKAEGPTQIQQLAHRLAKPIDVHLRGRPTPRPDTIRQRFEGLGGGRGPRGSTSTICTTRTQPAH